MSDGSQATPTATAEPKRAGAFAEPKRGSQIGRYVLLSKLGVGGMGVVMAAYDPELDRKVALKLLRPQSGKHAETGHRRLLAEAQALARLNDPNVVAVHDAGIHEDRVFVAMEFVEGQTLRQWLTVEPRSWAQVLDVMLPAGRGLAAAHARGLVHRDFKPGNVMLGDDGRARVMDFGLALAQESSTSVDEDDSHIQPRERALGQALTQAGKLIGTPAYMAPEQLAGERGGPEADQFAFCVSLWEGLYGQRPFAGQTLQELFSRVLAGEIEKPPKNARVPRWLRRLVERGLAVSPERRWPSMATLLAAIERGRARGRVRGLLTLGLLGIAGAMLVVVTEQEPRCGGARAKLQGVWDEPTRAAVAEAFAGTEMPYAEDARRSAEQTLDAHAARWIELHNETCEATRVRGDQSEALMDLRIGCLDGKLRDLAALTAVLATADAEVVKNAAQAVQALPSAEECVTLDRDAADVLQPADSALADEVEAVREQVAHVRALVLAGKYADGLTAAATAIEAARKTGYKPVIAEAASMHGDLNEKKQAGNPAREAYEEALHAAAASGHGRIEAQALIGLLSVWGLHLNDTEASLRYGRHAEAVLERLGDPPELLAALALYRGNTLMAANQLAAALVELERAVELSDGVAIAERIHLAALNNIPAVHGQLGHYGEALAAFLRSLELTEQRLGPWHPTVGINHLNLGVTYARIEDHERAMHHTQRALDIYTKTLEPHHAEIGRAHHNLGVTQSNQGSIQAAYQSYKKALEIKRRALGLDHISVAYSTNNVGDALIKLGRPTEAIPYCEEALRIWTKAQGEDNPSNLYPLISLSEAYLARDEPGRAEAYIRSGLALGEKGEIDPIEVAKARFLAARTIWAAGGDRNEAMAFAETAQRGYEASERPSTKEIAAIARWIDERR